MINTTKIKVCIIWSTSQKFRDQFFTWFKPRCFFKIWFPFYSNRCSVKHISIQINVRLNLPNVWLHLHRFRVIIFIIQIENGRKIVTCYIKLTQKSCQMPTYHKVYVSNKCFRITTFDNPSKNWKKNSDFRHKIDSNWKKDKRQP